MRMKRRGKKSAAKNLSPASAPPRSWATTATGRLNVILERVEEQQRVVIEAVTSNREALERKIDEGNEELAARIDAVEIAVRQNSQDILENSQDIRSLGDQLDTKADASRVQVLEERIGALAT